MYYTYGKISFYVRGIIVKVTNKLLLFLMIIANQAFASSESQPSMLQNIYSGTAKQLGQAKEAVANLLLGETEEKVSAGMTVAQASLVVQQIINRKPKVAGDEYWKTKNSELLRCAKLLLEETEKQILKTLQEIDKRLLYWMYYQKDQWLYFFSKSPLKWITGKKQSEEIATNIEQLKSKQEELYTRLGELSSIDWHEYLMAFNNYQASYAWIAKLLNMLSGMYDGVTVQNDNYDAIAQQLNAELKKVNQLTLTILSSLADTALPNYITRNWAWYVMLIIGAYYTYPMIAKYITPEAMVGYQQSTEKYWQEELLPPMKDIVSKVFFRSVTPEERKSLQNSLSALLDRIAPKEKARIINAEKEGNLVPLGELYDNMPKYAWNVVWKDDVAQIGSIFARLSLYHLKDTFSVVRNVALLTPSALVGWAGYRGYERLTKRDYTPMRLALIEISSLFVDQTKPLDNTEYGTMIYLLYNLKEKAKKDLPITMRNDFIKDLERVESREFDSAAKRRIIKDMFKKYTFLGLVQ